MNKFIKEVKNDVSNLWVLLKVKWRLYAAIKMADYKHFINNKKYYVMPHGKSQGIMVISREEIKVLKKKGIISKHAGAIEFQNESFYYTPSQRGKYDGPSLRERHEMRNRYTKYAKLLSPVMSKIKVGSTV